MASPTEQDRVRELQRALYRATKADSRMPPVKDVGEPCAGEPHARFEVAAGGNRNQSAIVVWNWAPPADPTPGFWPARPRTNECGEARLSHWGGGPLDGAIDGARQVAIRSTGAGSRCAREGVMVVTGTLTGSGRQPLRATFVVAALVPLA